MALVGLLGACGGDDEPAADTTPSTVPVTDPAAALAEPPPGEGVALIDGVELSFTVTACAEGAEEGDPPEAERVDSLLGEGTSDDGAFAVVVTTYRSSTGAGEPVLTQTAQITFGEGEEARGVEAKRTTAGEGGAWLDLTDPEADEPLISRTGDSVDVEATWGPAGARAGDEGLLPGRLRATCPA